MCIKDNENKMKNVKIKFQKSFVAAKNVMKIVVGQLPTIIQTKLYHEQLIRGSITKAEMNPKMFSLK